MLSVRICKKEKITIKKKKKKNQISIFPSAQRQQQTEPGAYLTTAAETVQRGAVP